MAQAGRDPTIDGPRASAPPDGESEGIVTGSSSLPPIKKNDGKLGLIALLLLLGAGALWFFLRAGEPEPQVEPVKPVVEAPPREPFAAELEIPDEEELEPAPEPAEPSAGERQVSAAPTTNPADWVCEGTIDAAAVRAVIQGEPSKQVQTCYERGLKNNNLLQGSMDVELTIGSAGAVRAVEVRGTLRDRSVYSCVKRVARTWKFPAPRGGCVRINAPFQMTPKL